MTGALAGHSNPPTHTPQFQTFTHGEDREVPTLLSHHVILNPKHLLVVSTFLVCVSCMRATQCQLVLY